MLRVPGMGTMSSPCASTHASASWAGVQPFSVAMAATASTSARFFAKFSPWKRGERRRKSSSARSSNRRMAPVRNPRPSGLYGTIVIPSSRQVAMMSPSMSRLQSEYSDCSAAIGCTLWARRMVSLPASDSPRKRTLPAATRSAMAPTVSSIGVFWSTRCW